MKSEGHKEWFSDIEIIVREPLIFKAKLGIGEDAYTTLRVKNSAYMVWDVAGAAGSAAMVAKSSVVASTFFAPTGWLAALGIGTAATPLGWVIAAGVLSGGAWFGITRYFKSKKEDHVDVIPRFINTPLDVLALGLFDLIVPLSLKVAHVDSSFSEIEKEHICSYFVREWGYDKDFVERGMKFIKAKIHEFSIKDLAKTLAEFQKKNPDCNYKAMTKEIIKFLRRITECDGRIDEREDMAIEKIESIFSDYSKFKFKTGDLAKKFPHIRKSD